jgi:hypothetical protein
MCTISNKPNSLEQNQETVAKAPAALNTEGVEGLVIVHLTHAANNFSIKFCRYWAA